MRQLWTAFLVAGILGGCAETDTGLQPDAAVTLPDAAGGGPGVRVPFAVDDYFIPSGYMGDGEVGGIERVEACVQPRPGEGRGLCHNFTWTPGGQGWAGVFWQFPEGSWGELPGLDIQAGATQVSLWAWGASGGEKVTFMTGMDDIDGFHAEAADVVLTTTPTQYFIDLAGVSYDDVTGGFGWVADTATEPVSFFMDDVQWR